MKHHMQSDCCLYSDITGGFVHWYFGIQYAKMMAYLHSSTLSGTPVHLHILNQTSLNQSGHFSQNIIIYKAFPHTGLSLTQYYFFVVFPHSWNHTVYTIETIVCDNPRRSAVSEILRPAQLVPRTMPQLKYISHFFLIWMFDVIWWTVKWCNTLCCRCMISRITTEICRWSGVSVKRQVPYAVWSFLARRCGLNMLCFSKQCRL